MQFKTRYNVKASPGLVCKTPSLAVQSEYESTTIDHYLKTYTLTGMLGDPSRISKAMYGDFTNALDYTASMQRVAAAKSAFEELPAKARAHFESVENFLDALADPARAAELKEFGLEVEVPQSAQETQLDATVRTDTEQTGEVSE